MFGKNFYKTGVNARIIIKGIFAKVETLIKHKHGFRAALFGGLFVTAGALGAGAGVAQTAGYRIVKTPIPFADLEKRLGAAVEANGMRIVNRASASEGAAGRNVKIPGDAVIGVFRNDFAVRMLAANLDAGIEAPVRFHLVEEPDGTSSIRYMTPGTVFGRYDGAAIKQVGAELDLMFEKIVSDILPK